ncbi:gag-pol polyprotein, partial [Tanacetum coccineum]
LGKLAHTKLTVELADRTVKYPKGIAKNVLVGIGKCIFLVDFIILDMPEDVKVPLILGRPFLSTAHAKIDVFKKKITLRNRSLDPLYGDYIELNDLNVPLELRRDQVDDLMPTINSIMRNKVEHKGKNVVRAFMNVPIFVEKFSVVTYFVVVENIDGYRNQNMGDIIIGEPFCKASCVEARRFDGLITIHNGSDNVTYQMARSDPRFKHLSSAQCNKIKPLL